MCANEGLYSVLYEYAVCSRQLTAVVWSCDPKSQIYTTAVSWQSEWWSYMNTVYRCTLRCGSVYSLFMVHLIVGLLILRASHALPKLP